MIVKPDSSDPGLSSDPIPIDTDHIDIAKPANRESEVYKLVLNFIKRPAERRASHEETGNGPLEKPIDWLSSWKASFERMRQRFGLPVAILLALSVAGGLVWWNWDDIAKRPGVDWVIARFSQHAVPIAKAGSLTIAVAHLENDKDREQEKLLLDGLSHNFEEVETLPIDRMVEWPASGTEKEAKKEAEGKARDLLKQSGADVLIWGSVINLNGKSAMRLYWTPSRDVSGAKASEKIYLKPIPLRCLNCFGTT